MPTVSTKWDIVSLFEHYCGVQTSGSSTVHGVLEVHSNCPWCPGSKDSFIMRPGTGQYTHMVRGGCPAHGDAIDLLMDSGVGPGMTRQEAMQELALEDVQFTDEKPAVRHENNSVVAPTAKWQEQAEVLLVLAIAYLWSGLPKANKALDYLHHRGLKDEIIKKARLGYVPLEPDGTWYSKSFDVWGLDPEKLTAYQLEKGCVRVPNGILIPWFVGGTIWKLAVKRPGEKKDYGQIMGSVDSLYNVDGVQYGEICLMVEGELDALSVLQEAGDLVSVCATGSTSKGRAAKWVAELMATPSFVLQSFDSDAAGDGAANIWIDLLMAQPCSKIDTPSFDRFAECKVERWPLMMWKDPNELLKAQLKNETEGFTLRDWVQLGVDLACHVMDQEISDDPLAREVSECIEVEYNPFEEDRISFPEPSTNSKDDRLEQYAETISKIVDELGGSEQVTLARHDGRSLNETYPTAMKPYEPVTLPPLPRARCPHGTVQLKRVSDEMSNAIRGRSCQGKPLTNGWCKDHADSQIVLEIGAQLNYPDYPEVFLGKQNARGIGEGVACWEAYAEHCGIEQVKQDIRQLHAKFNL